MSIKCYKKMQEFIDEFKQELEGILKKQPNNIIFTDNEHNDTIYGYMYDCNSNDVLEYEVKAVRYSHNQIEVLLGGRLISYTKEDVENAPDYEWEPLFDGNVLGWYTAIDIAESIDQYVNMEE